MKIVKFNASDYPRLVQACDTNFGYAEFLRRDGFKTIQYISEITQSTHPSHYLSEEEYTWFLLKWG